MRRPIDSDKLPEERPRYERTAASWQLAATESFARRDAPSLEAALMSFPVQLRSPLGHALLGLSDLGAGTDARPRRRQFLRHLRGIGATRQHLQNPITGCRMREHGRSREHNRPDDNRQR